MNRIERVDGGVLKNLTIVRYACVGGLAFAVDGTILVLLTEGLHWHYLTGATTGFVCGLAVNYMLCLAWVFPGHGGGPRPAGFAVFALIGVVGLLLNDGLMWLFTEVLHLVYFQSKLAAAGLVFFWNYFARKQGCFAGITSN
jgi:putative flippase GtrA